ncbi:MAG: BrnT family toxin [Dehalococcoidia bacterium]|nr:BrnT family toxin [Dehalococcoidia bacterium]
MYVVYTLRSGRVRVVTARDATRSERRTYRRNNQ